MYVYIYMYVHVLYQQTSIGVVSEAGDDSRASSSGKSVVLSPLKVPQSTCSAVEMRYVRNETSTDKATGQKGSHCQRE